MTTEESNLFALGVIGILDGLGKTVEGSLYYHWLQKPGRQVEPAMYRHLDKTCRVATLSEGRFYIMETKPTLYLVVIIRWHLLVECRQKQAWWKVGGEGRRVDHEFYKLDGICGA